MGLFDKRVTFKPFEYPWTADFKDAIGHSYWRVTEWNFLSDIQDFHVKLNYLERNAVKNALLAISQIEVQVKRFWGCLGLHIPKAEFDQVGFTFAESEVRHADAYSHLLEVLGLNDEFDKILEVPAIQGRVDYLNKYLKTSDNSNSEYAHTLALFSIFVENVSLFSQFLVIKSFNKKMNILKDIDNVVQATAKEEDVHAKFGIRLINQIKNEYPEWFGRDFYKKLSFACKKAYMAESEIIDWIFEKGELSFLTKHSVREFVKRRLNDSVIAIGGDQVFEVDMDSQECIRWFDEEIVAELSVDFFHKKSTAYSKRVRSITAEDLF
jgi:ribonucleoside-diphosphate reductase beta chain